MKRFITTACALCIVTSVVAQNTPPQRLFYSGHSLLDEPLPRDVAAIAASLGTPLQQWERDTPPGSSMRERVTELGIVTLPSGSDANRHAVYEAADKAMYEAKRGGKDGARASGWADL